MAGANGTRRIVTAGGIAAVLALAAIPALADPPGGDGSGPPTSMPVPPSDPVEPTGTGITGTPQSGRTLTLTRGSWEMPPSSPPQTDQKWIRCGSAPGTCIYIPGATGTAYVLGANDVGKTIKVRLRREGTMLPNDYTEFDTAPTPVVSAAPPPPPPPPSAAAAPQPPRLVQRPGIFGRFKQVSVLRGTPGRWTGTKPINFSYRWRRCDETRCKAIPAATRPVYRLQGADVRKRVVLAVRADNPAKGVSAATSLSSPLIAPKKIRRLKARVTISGRVTRRGVKLSKFKVRSVRGATISIRCRGRGCPFKRLSRPSPPGSLRVRRLQRRLRGGTVIGVRVTRSFTIGKYTRFRVRAGRDPFRIDRCLKPGETRPVRCRR